MQRRRTVLVVDGRETERRPLRDLLALEGNEVLEAANGPEAFEVAVRHRGPIDLVVADLEAALSDPRRFARLFGWYGRRSRVLFLSAEGEDALLARGIRRDAANLLPLPFDPAALSAKVRALLDGAPAPSEGPFV